MPNPNTMPHLDYPIQLQTDFEQAIAEKTYATGHTLTAADVALNFHSNANAAALVLNAAYRKGLVHKTDKGEFVVIGIAQPKVESVFQHAAKVGLAPTTQVRALELERADVTVASKLGVPLDSLVYRQDRTRNVGGETIANQRNYIPLEICPGLESQDLSNSSFQVLLESKYHAIVTRADETYQRGTATETDSTVLDLSVGAPVLCVERISFGGTGLPLVWADIHVRPDRSHYVIGLWPALQELLESA